MLMIDLPMPEACDVCPFNYDFCWCKAFDDDAEAWKKVEDDWNLNVCEREERPEYCPLKEIVMCKDCKHFTTEPDKNGFGVCMKIMHGCQDWGFCADGEHK